MKRTFIVLLALAGVGYAASLNEADWTWVGESAPPGVFDFVDQTLVITSNSNAKRLWYKTPQTPMVTGSGLSITFQFNTSEFLNDVGTELAIYLYGKDKDSEFHVFRVRNSKPNANIYESIEGLNPKIHDEYYLVDTTVDITTITVNYTVRDNKLCYNYLINGSNKVEEDVVADLTLDTTLDWRPAFGVSETDNEKMVYTVTDVTFKSVPEPTTAALSLLALAGLAARRRR